MKQKVFDYLNKNTVKHICMLECLRFDDVDCLYGGDDGVFLFDRTAQLYLLATDGKPAAERALKAAQDVPLIVCHSDHDAEAAREKYAFEGENKCWQVVWDSGEKMPLSGVCDIKKLELNDENVDFVFSHYTLAYNRDSIARIIGGMGMYGAYLNGTLVGFIGRHSERSMGLLEVLPEYRRMGIGSELEKFLVNKLIDNGEVPFAHIIYGNDKSYRMHRKYGFTFSDTPVYWLF